MDGGLVRVAQIMFGRFNSFQKTMLQWCDLHPYNAVHVVRLPGGLDANRLRLSLHRRLEQHGLTNLELDRKANAYAYRGGREEGELKIISGAHDPLAALAGEIELQLNMPFNQTGPFSPFRFFALPANDAFLLGLAYFHPVADAESIVRLLCDLSRAYLAGDAAEPGAHWRLYPEHRSRLLRHSRAVAGKLLALPTQVRNLKRSHRPRFRDAGDLKNGFCLFALSADQLHRLLAAGKAWQLTVNDVLLALLMKSVAPLAVSRAGHPRRNRISVGCIVNLRRELGMDSARTFGLFLGSFTVTHALPEGIPLLELAVALRRQTLAIKQQQLYLATPMELGLGRFVLRFFSPEQRAKFYQKNYPLWGGLTNMNLNSVWGPSDADPPSDYFRGVSTGPVTPLVFSVTTVGDRANVGLSYRATVFSPEEIEQVKSGFTRLLEALPEVA